nr:hypothetical protein [Candidatus Freyarchaeota archaeon]
MGKEQVVYEGLIRGVATGLSMVSHIRFGSRIVGNFTYFSIKLEENIGGIPDEILVRVLGVGYFRTGDRVLIQGKIVKIDLKQWDESMFELQADHFYNESLRIGDWV